MIKRASSDIFSGITLNNKGEELTHLQFADDTILFIRNNLRSVLGIKRVLQSFELPSGLKINFQKSQLFGFRANSKDLEFWASKLGCQVENHPITYLGMKLGSNPRSKLFWSPITDKLKKIFLFGKEKHSTRKDKGLPRQSAKLLVQPIYYAKTGSTGN